MLDLNANEQVTFLHRLKDIAASGKSVTADAAHNMAKAMTNRKV